MNLNEFTVEGTYDPGEKDPCSSIVARLEANNPGYDVVSIACAVRPFKSEPRSRFGVDLPTRLRAVHLAPVTTIGEFTATLRHKAGDAAA